MSKVLYFVVKRNESQTCTFEEMSEMCSLKGFVSPVLISRHVADNGVVRLATSKELAQIPIDEPGVRLAETVNIKKEVLLRFDQDPSKIDSIRLNWQNARYGEKTDRGHPLYVPEYELFPQLTQR